MIEAFADNMRVWDSHVLEPVRFIDAGERVVVFWHEEGRGKTSGVPVQSDGAVIYTVRAGHVLHVQGYMDRTEALEAAGLAE